MTAPGPLRRAAGDACPGVARPFSAADGAIVRVRPAGLPVPVRALAGLLDILAGQADPSIQLTSRAALQLRGLPDPVPPPVRSALLATGLVPSESHELVRNVVASPLSGLDGGGRCDVRPVVATLDDALRADPVLARLPGRFLLVLDDGRGDVVHESFDLGLLALGEARAAVLVGGTLRGTVVDLADAPAALLGLAREFLSARERSGSGAWHIAELTGFVDAHPRLDVDVPTAPARPVGAVGRHAVVGVPLGLLTRPHVDALARAADAVVVTPWRSLVVPGGAAALDDLAASGLVTTPDSPWLRLHACTGAPGCARTTVDTRRVARELAPLLPVGHLPVHISGCERHCGTTQSTFVDVLAPASVDDALRLVHDATLASTTSEDR